MYGGLSGGSDVCQTVSSPLVFTVLVGGSGGVANLKTVPVYQGVTDAFLRSSYATDPDGLQLLGDPSSYCVIALCVTE